MRKEIVLMLTCLSWAINLYAQEDNSAHLSDDSVVNLYGVASYKNLDEDIYLGAIYLPELASSVKTAASKRMQMRIVTDRLSTRRFTRLWLDAITLNSSRSIRNEYIQQIQDFGDLFEGNFIHADHVSFDYISSENKTVFLLNDIKIGEVSGEGFFEMLLNCWVGETPPSSEFKAGILSRSEEVKMLESKAQFASLNFTDERYNQIKSAFDNEAEKERVAELERQAQIAQQLEQQRLLEQSRLEALALEQARIEEEQEQQRIEIAEQAALAEAERLVLVAAEEKRLFESQQSKLYSEHQMSLSRWISKELEYPERALIRGLEGKIDLAIVTNRDGELHEVNIRKGSGSNILDEAALSTVKRSIPLPGMPEELVGETFSFVMPINFSLDD